MASIKFREQHWFKLFQWLCLFLFIVSFAIFITVHSTFLYRIDLQIYEIPKYFGYTTEQLMHNYHILIQYLDFPWISTLVFPDFPSSSSGLAHFSDVKKLFLLDYAVMFLTAIISFDFLRELFKKQQLWRLINPFKMAMFVPLGLGFLMFLGFDRFFVYFHEALFSNNDWLFDPLTDPIINVLPEEFFMHCFILAIACMELLFLLGIFSGRRQLHKKAK